MSNHTSGDWHNYGPIIHKNGQYIAIVCVDKRNADGDRGSDEQRANAILIKSSPKLLTALQALLDWGREHTSPTQPNSPHQLLLDAHNTIAEATRQP